MTDHDDAHKPEYLRRNRRSRKSPHLYSSPCNAGGGWEGIKLLNQEHPSPTLPCFAGEGVTTFTESP